MKSRILTLLAVVPVLLLSLAGVGSVSAAELHSPDSVALASVGRKLQEYVKVIEPLDSKAQQEECDFLISSCRDSVTRQYVATWLYKNYVSSHIMGIESVALHIADNWFFSGKVKAVNDADLMDMRIWADFNRQSMVGEKAPELVLFSSDGADVRLFGDGTQRRYSIVYFYDTGCSSCLVQSVMLQTYLSDVTYPVDFYAVYTGADSLSWRTYREKRFSSMSSSVHVANLWDPDISSDFQKKYGVMSTPQMVLVDKNCIIVGRKLDVPALRTMMTEIYSSDDYEYGSDSTSMAMIEAIFQSLGDSFTSSEADKVIDEIAVRSMQNLPVFKKTVGDMFYYLSSSTDGRCKEAAKYLADKYILSRPDLWDTSADSLKVVGYAKTVSDLMSRAEPGKPVPDVTVEGIMSKGGVPSSVLSWNSDDSPYARKWRLSRLHRDVYILFFSENCASCKAEVEAADAMMKADRKVRFLFVRASSNLPAEVLDAFDLSVLPFCLHIDRQGNVIERYVDLRHHN